MTVDIKQAIQELIVPDLRDIKSEIPVLPATPALSFPQPPALSFPQL